MNGLDLTPASLAEPPRQPLDAATLTREHLVGLGRRITARTWGHGLPSWSWGEAVALVGMIRFARAAGDDDPDAIEQRIGAWLNAHFTAGVTIDHVNNVAPGVAAVLTARGDVSILSRAEPLASWVEASPHSGSHSGSTATRAPNGAIEHWPGGVWADTVFMAGVFLGHLASATGRADRLGEFGRQLVAHAEVLQAPSGLFAHGSHRGETIPCYWGRANAWCASAAVEFLELASVTGMGQPAHVDEVAANLRRQLTALAGLQPAHGVWSVLVDDQPECARIVETSAAAGIGAAMLRASAVVPDLPGDVAASGWLAVRGALAYVDDAGTLTRTSAGTVLQLIPFGYSVIRDDRLQLWGQGLALHAIAAALEVGG